MATRRAGRYLLHDAIASGGMASVHLGRVVGLAGFSRTVAIKRLHAHLAADPEFVAMFLDEARLASRIHHPNVVATLDVVTHDGELLLVMEHVLGESWWHVMRAARERGEPVPVNVAVAVIGDLLNGLHAAHEARAESGEPLEIVHRDVSPQNVLVGVDGVARVVDFGIAKAISRVHSTREGELKGKLAYMAPEQIKRKNVDRRADVYAAGVVFWETLAGRRLFAADDAPAIIAAVLEGSAPTLSTLRGDVPPELDAIVAKAIARDPEARYASALELVTALESVVARAPPRAVAEFVMTHAAGRLEARRRLVETAEQTPSHGEVDLGGEAAAAIPGALSPQERSELASAATASLVVAATPAEDTASSSSEVRRTGTKRLRAVAVLAVALGIVVGVSASVWMRRAPEASATPAAPPSAEPAPPPASAAQVAPSSPPAVADDPGPSVPVAPVAPVATTRKVPRVAHPAPRAGASHRASDCEPNYTIDANGVKRFKPQCL